MKEPKYGPKYGKYIIDSNVKRPKEHPVEEPTRAGQGLVVFVDDDVIKGSFYLNCAFMMNRTPDNAIYRPEIHELIKKGDKSVDISKISKPHAHNFGEYLVFLGTNPEDRRDLGGEVELWIDGEKQVITKSCGVWCPAGIFHLPVNFLRLDRPIIWITTAPAPLYSKWYDPDPKWDGFLELGNKP